MKEFVLTDSGSFFLRDQTALGETLESFLMTGAQVRKLLKCSLRQLYRYVHEKRIKPVGKFMGRLVFRTEDIALFHKPRRGRGARLPKFLKPVFWSYRMKDIDPCGHAYPVVGQILQHGDLGAVRWALDYYGLDYLLRVAGRYRELDPRTRNFWLNYGKQVFGASEGPG